MTGGHHYRIAVDRLRHEGTNVFATGNVHDRDPSGFTCQNQLIVGDETSTQQLVGRRRKLGQLLSRRQQKDSGLAVSGGGHDESVIRHRSKTLSRCDVTP
jgi:hypothetical protein